MRSLALTLVLICFLIPVRAQDAEVQKLSQKIIDGGESDREKVEKIHHWITHNIRYDVKKYLSYDFTDVPLDKIIGNKKAICYGYSKLFDALCAANNIPSVTVNGYIKTFEVDPVDSFYLDQHCWNAVLLDETWYLVDVTWDAGYTRSYRSTILSSIAYGILHIPYIKTVYDPKFVQAPNEDYFLKSGNYFSTDHLAALPIWQLMDHEMSIEDFRTDSTFYFLQKKEDQVQLNNNSNERMAYYRMDLSERQIFGGRRAYLFNKLNQFNMALSYYVDAGVAFDELLEYDSKEEDEYRDVANHLQFSILHADSMIMYLNKEYRSLNRAFKAKKDIHRTYTREYLRYTTKIIRTETSDRKKIEMMKSSIKKYRIQFQDNLRSVLESEDFENTEFRHQGEALDSANQGSYADSVQRAFDAERERIKSMKDRFANQHIRVLSMLQDETAYLDSLREHFNYLFITRRQGFDDYDFPITGKKMLFQMADSNHYFGKVYFLDSLRLAYKGAVELIKDHIKTTRTLASSYKKLRRMQISNGVIINDYDRLMKHFEEDILLSEEILLAFNGKLNEYQKLLQKLNKGAKRAEKIIELELQVEYDKSPYKARIRAHKRLAKEIIREDKRLWRKVERKIQKLN